MLSAQPYGGLNVTALKHWLEPRFGSFLTLEHVSICVRFDLQTGSKGQKDGELFYPWGVALSTAHGNDDTFSLLFVGDTNNNRIAVFNVV